MSTTIKILAFTLILTCSITKGQGQTCITEIDSITGRTVYTFAEQAPEFPGGNDSLFAFFIDNFKYPSGDINVSGKVYIAFIVETSGLVSNVITIRSIHPSFDDEAKRVIGLMPTWTPGKCNGENVAVRMILPVNIDPK